MQLVRGVVFVSLLACLADARAASHNSTRREQENRTSAKEAKERREEQRAQAREHREEEKKEERAAAFRAAQAEAQGALSALERLRSSLAHNLSEEVVNHSLRSIASAAEDDFEKRRGALQLRFAGSASEAQRAIATMGNTSGANRSQAAAARKQVSQALSSMRHLDSAMRKAEREYVRDVRRGTERLSDQARHQARRAESEGDHLARRARWAADRLERLGSKDKVDNLTHLSDGVDAMERSADDAERKLSDEVEEGARKADDLSRKLADLVEREAETKVDMHREARDGAMREVEMSLAAVQDVQQSAPSAGLVAGWTFFSALAGGVVAAATLAHGRRSSGLQETLLA